LHFTAVTSPKSLEYINRAKQTGAAITCSVTPAHLYFSDEDLQTYDTNLKLFPPVRNVSEKEALKEAVLNGLVDCISSHHQPHEYDSKICEFEYAKTGMIGLESCYGVMGAIFGDQLTAEKWIELISINPRKILGLELPSIQEGTVANITMFDPEITYTFTEDAIKSKSKNSAFIGKELKGKVIGIINNKQLKLN
jgi:dihydroorotase